MTMLCPNDVPYPTGGGQRENQAAILAEWLGRGHTAQIIYRLEHATPDELTWLGKQPGVSVAGADEPEDIQRIGDDFAPDVIFGLGALSVGWGGLINPTTPRVCFSGDPSHLIPMLRRQYELRSVPLSYGELVALHNQAMELKSRYLPVLKGCAAVMCGAAQSVAWYRSMGVACEYIPNSVADPHEAGWRRGPADWPQNPKPVILQAGHLQGIATMSGLYFLAEDVLPHLHDVASFEWRVCGAQTLTVDLTTRFKPWPQVNFTGYVEDIGKEFADCDIFLCTTPEAVGVRTRIIEAMAHGCCVVAHAVNAVGQPELEDGKNILLGETGGDIARLIERAAFWPKLRMDLGQAARETFERYFSPAQSQGRIVDRLEWAASAGNRAATPHLINYLPVAAQDTRGAEDEWTPQNVTPASRKNRTSQPGADPRSDPGRPLPPLQPGYHDDAALIPLVDSLLPKVGLFIETGTANGSTLLYTAERAEALGLPNLPLLSCEPHRPIALVAERNLWQHTNAMIFRQTSGEFLAGLPADCHEKMTLFFLDAHSHGFGNGCPLPEEVNYIMTHWRGGYIIADDFQVPGQPQFGYDVYPEIGAIGMKMIEGSIPPESLTEVWYPTHSQASAKSPLRGWCLLTFGNAPPLEVPEMILGMMKEWIGSGHD